MCWRSMLRQTPSHIFNHLSKMCHLTGVRGSQFLSLVMGRNLYVERVCPVPPKANPILVVNRDSPLSFSVALQWVKPIASRRLKVAVKPYLIDVVQFPSRPSPSVLW